MRSQCDGGGGISRSIEDIVVLEFVGNEGKRPIMIPPDILRGFGDGTGLF